MNIIFGFGVTEEGVRAAVKNALISALLEKKDVATVLRQWNDKADEYDKMPRGTAPERYTRIYFYENAIHFHHINREHPFSPDGWALLQVDEPFGEPQEVEL